MKKIQLKWKEIIVFGKLQTLSVIFNLLLWFSLSYNDIVKQQVAFPKTYAEVEWNNTIFHYSAFRRFRHCVCVYPCEMCNSACICVCESQFMASQH